MSFISRVFSLTDRFFPNRIGNRSSFNLSVLNASTQFNNYALDRQKLAVVLSNPAALKVFALQCDLFSMGRVSVKQNDKELESDPFLDLLKSPNPFQTEAQFKWDFMFWLMIGTDYTYIDSRVVDKKGNKMYHLMPSKLEYPYWMQLESDKLIFSDAEVTRRSKELLRYRYDDGSKFDFPMDRLVTSFDLSNGTGNFYKGGSRLDALYKVLSNSEAALDSKNINVRYAGKFLVGTNNTADKLGLTDLDKQDIIEKMETNEKQVFPLKTMVEIRRFVDNLRVLELGTAFQEDFFIIGGMYGIPKDVLEAYIKSSTFENQEKARMAHVAYCLQPKGEQWMDSYERHFGYDKLGKDICITWDHLPMMNVFKEKEATTKKTQIETLDSLLKMGVPLREANEFLGTNFTIEKQEPKEDALPNGNEEEESGQGEIEDSPDGEGEDEQQPNGE